MGSLRPGATYVYERVGSTTYARELGSDPNTRFAIGWDYGVPKDGKRIYQETKDARLWKDIRETARSNPTLQKALDRAILVYKIVKNKSDE